VYLPKESDDEATDGSRNRSSNDYTSPTSSKLQPTTSNRKNVITPIFDWNAGHSEHLRVHNQDIADRQEGGRSTNKFLPNGGLPRLDLEVCLHRDTESCQRATGFHDIDSVLEGVFF
jgi:hypothetical protein